MNIVQLFVIVLVKIILLMKLDCCQVYLFFMWNIYYIIMISLYLANLLYSWYIQRKRQSTPLDDESQITEATKVKKKSKKEKKIKKEKLDVEEENWMDKIGQLKIDEEKRKQSFDNHNLLFLKKNKYFFNMKCWGIIKFVDEEMYNVFIHKTILLLHLNW